MIENGHIFKFYVVDDVVELGDMFKLNWNIKILYELIREHANQISATEKLIRKNQYRQRLHFATDT